MPWSSSSSQGKWSCIFHPGLVSSCVEHRLVSCAFLFVWFSHPGLVSSCVVHLRKESSSSCASGCVGWLVVSPRVYHTGYPQGSVLVVSSSSVGVSLAGWCQENFVVVCIRSVCRFGVDVRLSPGPITLDNHRVLCAQVWRCRRVAQGISHWKSTG